MHHPKIIEVCGKRFLYSEISNQCNGIGCGCFITFIYDLETYNPTFIENYRILFDGFYVSVFINDNNPDLLVISQTITNEMKGSDLEEFQVKLIAYQYDNGAFKMNIHPQCLIPYCYNLYGFTSDFYHSYYDNLIYSIPADKWFRN